ncbi:peptidylprolyl isomerase [Arenicella chitinivorans]|nr:peptidylprolyl isomerase [Arenicella chitinivorans]
MFNSRRFTRAASATLCLITLSVSPLVWGWGERGHDVVTRVAVQNLRQMAEDNAQLVTPFLARDHMLAHLSNVPDIVWRAPYMSQQDRDSNYSTHYINLERVYSEVKAHTDVPFELTQYQQDARSKGLSAVEVGTAPWRVLQLYQAMVDALSSVPDTAADSEYEAAINEALLYAGLMSHFVGDLANPHHTTANYDGQLSGQKGLHGYFESDVVMYLPLGLSAKVSTQANQMAFQDTWFPALSDEQRAAVLRDPQALIWALLADSHSYLPQLLDLDKSISLVKPSRDPKQRAERKSAKVVAQDFESFAVERLAFGSWVLARLWWLAWDEAGQPDMTKYRSYHYPVKPDFVDPDYLLSDDENAVTDATWRALDLDRVIVMQLPSGRVVIELAPQFAPKHVENILLMTREGYFDGTAVIRSQENYVAQWGDTAGEESAAKSLGSAKQKVKVEFFADPQAVGFTPVESRDSYADQVGFVDGLPTASDGKQAWLAHCYGMVGVSRGMGDDSGNGSGLYVVTGHSPRHLDLNVTLVGRVLEGMEHLTTLPRGTGSLGFYEDPAQYVPIDSVKVASALPEGSIDIAVMRTDSAAFREHVAARTTRKEDWFLHPAGRIGLCNIAVPTSSRAALEGKAGD